MKQKHIQTLADLCEAIYNVHGVSELDTALHDQTSSAMDAASKAKRYLSADPQLYYIPTLPQITCPVPAEHQNTVSNYNELAIILNDTLAEYNKDVTNNVIMVLEEVIELAKVLRERAEPETISALTKLIRHADIAKLVYAENLATALENFEEIEPYRALKITPQGMTPIENYADPRFKDLNDLTAQLNWVLSERWSKLKHCPTEFNDPAGLEALGDLTKYDVPNVSR